MNAAAVRGPVVERVEAVACTIPTDALESDGTAEWDSTTIVIVEAHGEGERGLGYSYADASAAVVVRSTLAAVVEGRDAMAVRGAWEAMVVAVRNLGRPGIASHAISAVDIALWDLKARLLGLPLHALLGSVRDCVAVYGSGGFTSYGDDRLAEQLGGWARQGMAWVKMKVGREPARDPGRARIAREAVGDAVGLFVDANGAHRTPSDAIAQARAFAEVGVTWFEEPLSSEDVAGLARVRAQAPAGMAVTAGEYAYTAADLRRLLDGGAVDVLQADATRCGGVTGFLVAGELCVAHHRPLSAHTAPSIHAHLGCAVEPVIHLEWFHDHARIEPMLFSGVLEPVDGALAPDPGRPGLGIELRAEEVERWAA